MFAAWIAFESPWPDEPGRWYLLHYRNVRVVDPSDVSKLDHHDGNNIYKIIDGLEFVYQLTEDADRVIGASRNGSGAQLSEAEAEAIALALNVGNAAGVL